MAGSSVRARSAAVSKHDCVVAQLLRAPAAALACCAVPDSLRSRSRPPLFHHSPSAPDLYKMKAAFAMLLLLCRALCCSAAAEPRIGSRIGIDSIGEVLASTGSVLWVPGARRRPARQHGPASGSSSCSMNVLDTNESGSERHQGCSCKGATEQLVPVVPVVPPQWSWNDPFPVQAVALRHPYDCKRTHRGE